MNLLFLLIFVSVPFSRALSLPYNSSSILQLPSQNTISNVAAVPWPSLPVDRYIRNGISLNITSYGDTLSASNHPSVLQALLALEHTILDVGKPNEKLNEITTAADVKGDVYVEVGFYSLHPPVGIKIGQAGDVLHKVWELLMEYYPPKEIPEATVLLKDKGLALFRLSLRVQRSNGQARV